MANRSKASHGGGTSKHPRKKPPTKGKPEDQHTPMPTEPRDELLPETPTPEPTAPLPAPVPFAEPAPAETMSAPAPSPSTPAPSVTPPSVPAPKPEPTPPPQWQQSPDPSPPPHLPHFEAVKPAPETGAPHAKDEKPSGEPVPDNEWVRVATTRRGNPELACLGWTLVLIGLAVLAATYYWGVAYGNLFAPAGIRGDLIAAVLLVVGLAVGVVFLFVPTNRRTGLGTDATLADIENLVRYTNGQVLLSQILAGVGLALTILGLIWMVYWLRSSWLYDTEISSGIGGSQTATYVLGVPLAVMGLFLLFFFLGRVSAARRTRNVAVLLMMRLHHGLPSPASSEGSPSGVTEQEVQDLMKRLDALMAQLPDAAVTEFSKTKEADTYLKLLGP